MQNIFSGQPALNFLLCGLLLFVVLLLSGMAIMMAYAMAEKRSVARNEKTQGDDEGFATSRDDDNGPTVRRKAEDATTMVSAQSKAPVVLEQREKSGKIHPNS
ncbi:uncharacterized protein LOC142766984 [Rhipicephalus microplus]|uniref:uncharacterized protein LOC142766984 n=1 Tax=Rhipicephalus microplus TaxID=6941 RepID=UPI003F6CB7C5